MKRSFAWMLAAACVFSLAGCGGEKPAASDDAEQAIKAPAMETLRAANDPLEVLKNHRTVVIDMESQSASGDVTASGEILYRRDSAGALEMDSRTHYLGDQDSWAYAMAYSAGEDPLYPGSGTAGAYYNDDESGVCMTCFPAEEYEAEVARRLPPIYQGALSDGETVTGCAEQDGALVVTTMTKIAELNSASETEYYIDPETNLLLAMVITDYDSAEDGAAAAGTTRWNWTYDGDYRMDWEYPHFGGNDADNTCELTIVIDPGRTDEEIQNFGVAQGTMEDFDSETPYTVYMDEALTEEAPSCIMDTNRDRVTYYIALNR